MQEVNPVVSFGDAPEARAKHIAKIYYGVNLFLSSLGRDRRVLPL